MADSSNSTLAPSANPHDFDPANWLARFRTAGGWWIVGADDKLTLGWHLHGQANDTAREIFREIEQDPAKRAAVRELILTGQGPAQGLEAEDAVHPQVGAILDPWERGQLTTSEAWDALLARLRAVELPGGDDSDEAFALADDLASALMAMPAPNAAALRWKLDLALEICNGSVQPWSEEYVRQTVEDYRRLLGDA